MVGLLYNSLMPHTFLEKLIYELYDEIFKSIYASMTFSF